MGLLKKVDERFWTGRVAFSRYVSSSLRGWPCRVGRQFAFSYSFSTTRPRFARATTFKKVLNILESAPGRPQRTASTEVPEASEPTKSGTAEPKVEDKTEDKDVPDASARRAEKPTLAAPATPAAKVDFVDSSEEVESVEWSRFKV